LFHITSISLHLTFHSQDDKFKNISTEQPLLLHFMHAHKSLREVYMICSDLHKKHFGN